MLAGCWDSGCCKKHAACAPTEQVAQTATPKESCSHAGCSHDHSKDTSNDHAEEMAADEVATEEVVIVADENDTDEK